MKNGEKDDIFINRMLEETYRFLPERESGKASIDLLAYFIKQDKSALPASKVEAKTVISELGLDFIKWDFCESNSCFRFSYNQTLIDIPANWSFFNKLFVVWQTGREELFLMNAQSEEAHFWEVMNLLTPYACDFAFWVSDQKIYLVFIPAEKKQLFSELEKKLGLVVPGPIQKVA